MIILLQVRMQAYLSGAKMEPFTKCLNPRSSRLIQDIPLLIGTQQQAGKTPQKMKFFSPLPPAET